ncbi:deoxyuridine 5'-triphosphate nucleotidohydrolase [Blautia sp.]|jgi:dUTP pyrophosphatase|uniref:deoxyuridine 5'-triphosphate nucleotidohydrolase n=1 Tax=Blautia sp. TaxID=1955243 RepID=UPI00280BD21E|nr:deoxyuridine 5'-triphosphate nucleotidohydrolase [Blautia sp.]MDY3017238.1 deoxyuridine 5'-triphosphate nucleotidohydrolase [Blautia sp.]MED9881120.1 deoxyuridine 5'-triphosphate nucleotidohydrolase [Blautia sp.]
MKRIAKFHKVSEARFLEDWKDNFPEASDEEIKEIYKNIALPKRATAGSAGYDFYAPADFSIAPGESIKIPTGIRVEMDQEWVLKCYPRSGLGFKYRLQLNNTVGIIDSDYFYSDNEGHMFAKLTNDGREGKTVELAKGTGFMQGIFVEYGITVDDDATGIRNGGFGSTTNK